MYLIKIIAGITQLYRKVKKFKFRNKILNNKSLIKAWDITSKYINISNLQSFLWPLKSRREKANSPMITRPTSYHNPVGNIMIPSNSQRLLSVASARKQMTPSYPRPISKGIHSNSSLSPYLFNS